MVKFQGARKERGHGQHKVMALPTLAMAVISGGTMARSDHAIARFC
jgi:hypothetical protein